MSITFPIWNCKVREIIFLFNIIKVVMRTKKQIRDLVVAYFPVTQGWNLLLRLDASSNFLENLLF